MLRFYSFSGDVHRPFDVFRLTRQGAYGGGVAGEGTRDASRIVWVIVHQPGGGMLSFSMWSFFLHIHIQFGISSGLARFPRKVHVWPGEKTAATGKMHKCAGAISTITALYSKVSKST